MTRYLVYKEVASDATFLATVVEASSEEEAERVARQRTTRWVYTGDGSSGLEEITVAEVTDEETEAEAASILEEMEG